VLGEQGHYAAHTLSDGIAATAPSGSTAQQSAAIPGVKQQPGQEGAIYDLLARALGQQQDHYQVLPTHVPDTHMYECMPNNTHTDTDNEHNHTNNAPNDSKVMRTHAQKNWHSHTSNAPLSLTKNGHTQTNKLGASTALTGHLPVGAVGNTECLSQSYQQLIGLTQGLGMPYASSAVPGLAGHDNPGASGSVEHTNVASLSLALSGAVPSNGLSSRRPSMLSDTSSIWGVRGSMSRRGSLAGGDALGIGAFNAMREAGLLPLATGRRGSLAGGDALGIGAFNAMRETGGECSSSSAGGASRRGSLSGGDALGIGLFNAMREAGALGGGAGAGASNAGLLRHLVSLKGEGDNLVLPQPGKHSQARRASICSLTSVDGVEPSSLLLQLGAAAWARENSVKAETVEEKNVSDGAAPLTPSEIEKVVGRIEVDENVSAVAPVAT
jgi:hypothetical protein